MSRAGTRQPASALTTAGLAQCYDHLRAAYGAQHWWPHQDRDNPRFEILIGAVLTQHTAWTNVERAIARLRTAGPLNADTLLGHADLAELIRQAGPHRVKAERLTALCRWFVEAGGFEVIETWSTPVLCTALRSVRGVGPETADVIALYAFSRPRFIADAYAFRLFERYGAWRGRTRRYETLREAVERSAPGDWHAADYDELHALIVEHGKRTCHKRAPACDACVLAVSCEQRGLQRG